MHRTAYLKSGNLSEEALHRQGAAFLRLALPPAAGVLWAHIPNGGKRPPGEGGKMKALGARAGMSDLYFGWRSHILSARQTGWIELKSATGVLSPEQRDFLAEVEGLGDVTAVCRSLAEVEGTLRAWLPANTLRATLMPGGGFMVADLRQPRRSVGKFDVVGATAARDVSPWQPWPFPDHRSLADADVRDAAAIGGAP